MEIQKKKKCTFLFSPFCAFGLLWQDFTTMVGPSLEQSQVQCPASKKCNRDMVDSVVEVLNS